MIKAGAKYIVKFIAEVAAWEAISKLLDISFFPSEDEENREARDYYEQGISAWNNHDYVMAVSCYTKAEKLSWNNKGMYKAYKMDAEARVAFVKGIDCWDSENYKEAARNYKIAFNIASNTEHKNIYKGYLADAEARVMFEEGIFFEQNNNFTQAIESYNKAIDIVSNDIHRAKYETRRQKLCLV